MAVSRPQRRPGRHGELLGTLRFFALVAIGFFLLRATVVQAFYIPSASMQPGLIPGDYLVVAKWPYGYGRASLPGSPPVGEGRLFGRLPARGDVVVFKHPATGVDVIKRVIGLPGDRVALRDGVVELNGAPVPRDRIADWPLRLSPNSPCRVQGARVRQEEDVCRYPRYRETDGATSWTVLDQGEGRADDWGPATVPAGRLLVMGDNRDDSLDGRFPTDEGGVGLLPADALVGKAVLIFFSTDGSAQWLKPWTWVTAARPERIGTAL